MKIMSFNTQHCQNYISGKIDFESVAKVITDFGADIVGLNEMRGAGEHLVKTAQTERLAELTGMNYYFAKAIDVPRGGPYGNAIEAPDRERRDHTRAGSSEGGQSRRRILRNEMLA